MAYDCLLETRIFLGWYFHPQKNSRYSHDDNPKTYYQQQENT